MKTPSVSPSQPRAPKAEGLDPSAPAEQPKLQGVRAAEVGVERVSVPRARMEPVDLSTAGRIAALPVGPASSSAEGLESLLDTIWARRENLSLQPSHTMVYRLSGLEVPAESAVPLLPFLDDVKTLARSLPPSCEAGTTSLGATRVDLVKGLERAQQGELPGTGLSKLEWGRFRFHRKSWDAAAGLTRTYVNTKPGEGFSWAKRLVEAVLTQPAKFPGVELVDLAGPGAACRPDDVTVLTSSKEGRIALHAFLTSEAERRPESLEQEIIPGAEGVRPGVSWGEEPPLERYPGRTFRSVRARVLFETLKETLAEDGDRAALGARVKARLVEAGIDPEQPHRNLPSPGLRDAELQPLPGVVRAEPGVYTAKIMGFEGPVEVEVVVTPEVAARLQKQRKMAFVPEEGRIGFMEPDRTRDPPRQTVREWYALTHRTDQAYKIETGSSGPTLLARDEEGAFYVPRRVKLMVSDHPTRPFEAVCSGVAERAQRTPEPVAPLVKRFIEPDRALASVARAAARIEHYLGSGTEIASAVPLEEGVNGKAIVRFTNGAMGLWKPSSAEFPELMRAQLDPDHFARREAFAYEVSKALGHLGRVPPTLYREVGGEPGALMALVRDSEAGLFSEDLDAFLAEPEAPAYREIALLDHVLGALDRHHGNILFVKNNVIAVDHGVCLPRRHGDQGAHQYLLAAELTLSESERARIEGALAGRQALETKARALGINEQAVTLMFERMAGLLETGRVNHAWRTA